MMGGGKDPPSSLDTPTTPLHDDGSCSGWLRGRDYRRGNRLGKGGFGVVYECINMAPKYRGDGTLFLRRGALFAEKVVDMPDLSDTSRVADLTHEIQILSELNHPHIVRYYGCAISGKVRSRFHLFMECVPGGSLKDVVSQFGLLSESVVQVYSEQILQALDYLHSNGYIHRDLKASNILVTTSSTIKVTDFGTCHKMSRCCTANPGPPAAGASEGLLMESSTASDMNIEDRHPGTPYFFPPERVLEGRIGYQTDVWALGCVVLEMVNGTVPFASGSNYMQVYYRVGSGEKPAVPPESSPNLKDFLGLCFEVAENRPTAQALLSHRFITEDTQCDEEFSEINSEEEEAEIMERSSFATLVTTLPNMSTMESSLPTTSNVYSPPSGIPPAGAAPPAAPAGGRHPTVSSRGTSSRHTPNACSDQASTTFTSATAGHRTAGSDEFCTDADGGATPVSEVLSSYFYRYVRGTRAMPAEEVQQQQRQQQHQQAGAQPREGGGSGAAASSSSSSSSSEWSAITTIILYTSTAAHGAHLVHFLLRKQRRSLGWLGSLCGPDVEELAPHRHHHHHHHSCAKSVRHSPPPWVTRPLFWFLGRVSPITRLHSEVGVHEDPHAPAPVENVAVELQETVEAPVSCAVRRFLAHPIAAIAAFPVHVFNAVWDFASSDSFRHFLAFIGAAALLFKMARSTHCLILLTRYSREAYDKGLSRKEVAAHVSQQFAKEMKRNMKKKVKALDACEMFVQDLCQKKDQREIEYESGTTSSSMCQLLQTRLMTACVCEGDASDFDSESE